MDDRPEPTAPASFSPRTTRALATFTQRVLVLFPGCPADVARAAAILWTRTCPPPKQEREARITHDETVRNALIEHVRATMTDWPARVLAGRADALAKKQVQARVREILEGWKARA